MIRERSYLSISAICTKLADEIRSHIDGEYVNDDGRCFIEGDWILSVETIGWDSSAIAGYIDGCLDIPAPRSYGDLGGIISELADMGFLPDWMANPALIDGISGFRFYYADYNADEGCGKHRADWVISDGGKLETYSSCEDNGLSDWDCVYAEEFAKRH